MIRYLGGKSIAGAFPFVASAAAQLVSLVAPHASRVAALEAQLAAPFVPPNPAMMLASLQSAIAGLSSALFALPAQVAKGKLQAASDLASLLGVVTATKALASQLQGIASTGGLHAWAYEGPASGLGSALAAETSSGIPGGAGPGGQLKALVIVTDSPTAWAALGGIASTGI